MAAAIFVAPETILNEESLLKQLEWRYATKAFDPTRKIPAKTWDALEQALVLAPSSYGLQPWKFFIVTNPEIRTQLKAVSWNQTQITDASHLVVFTVKSDLNTNDVIKFVERIQKVRGVPAERLDAYKTMMIGSVERARANGTAEVWSTRQVYIALGMFLTAAAALGIDACPMEGFENAAYDKILGLEGTGYKSVVVATAAYRSASDVTASLPKVRFEKNELISHI